MFYVYMGDVHVTPAGQQVPEYKMLRMEYPKEKQFNEILVYIYYVYTKKDNPYWGLPPKERRVHIINNYGLFDWTTWEKVEQSEDVKNLIDFYKRIQLTDSDINAEAFRAKAEYWRVKLMDMTNSPDEEEAYANALATATKLAEEFKIKAELEIGEQDHDGVALYLFEIPEDKKPYHHRIKLS